ncbi:MAG: ferrochelatase [Candidatus Latescibacteria bacterium]|nr:ferrochelatase [Candidatus Latescibacterota bacterium]
MSTVPTPQTAPIGVLVAQLGTPEAPTAKALKPYLRQFLSDPRVIDLPRWKWLPILHLFILTRRPARSAALYQNIWRPEGSPLLLYSRAQAEGLQQRLGSQYRVVLGMRYGEPSIARAMAQLAAEGIDRILVFPMFPQFSASTTGSLYDAVNQASTGRRCPLFFERRRTMPALRWVPPYYAHPLYIDALKTVYQESVGALEHPPDRHLITFHGIPQRYVDEGDPYRSQCETTAQLLAQALALADDQWLLGFQSRFGKEPWLQPYTEEILLGLGGKDVFTLAATCPSFTADCLETLDEVGREGEEQFHQGGGGHLHLVPCLNDHPVWLDAMAAIARQETAGWIA